MRCVPRRDSCATYVHLPSPSALMPCQLLHQASEGSDDGSGSEKEDEADKEAADQPTEDPDTMHWVFNRISRLIRPRRPTCRAAGLRWMGAVASKLEAEQLRPYLVRSRWWLCIIRCCVAAVAVAHDAPACLYHDPTAAPNRCRVAHHPFSSRGDGTASRPGAGDLRARAGPRGHAAFPQGVQRRASPP